MRSTGRNSLQISFKMDSRISFYNSLDKVVHHKNPIIFTSGLGRGFPQTLVYGAFRSFYSLFALQYGRARL